MPILAVNKHAGHDYEILETFEAGLVLTGQEVKSAKSGQVNLKGSYVSLRVGKKKIPNVFLVQAGISLYKCASPKIDYDEKRERRLLLKKSEVSRLMGKQQEKGLTLLPLKLYTKKGLIKLEVGLARGKKLYDKREALKNKDIERDVRRTLKNR